MAASEIGVLADTYSNPSGERYWRGPRIAAVLTGGAWSMVTWMVPTKKRPSAASVAINDSVTASWLGTPDTSHADAHAFLVVNVGGSMGTSCCKTSAPSRG